MNSGSGNRATKEKNSSPTAHSLRRVVTIFDHPVSHSALWLFLFLGWERHSYLGFSIQNGDSVGSTSPVLFVQIVEKFRRTTWPCLLGLCFILSRIRLGFNFGLKNFSGGNWYFCVMYCFHVVFFLYRVDCICCAGTKNSYG